MERPNLAVIPTGPGSYQFVDPHGRVIYVGKAANLRARVTSYFADPGLLHSRTVAMVTAASDVRWIEVKSEVDALMLEYNLIKQHRPRFNVRLRDDKSYPFLALTLDEQWPRAVVMRGRKRKGTKYFGPFAHAWAIRDTLDALLRTFPVRTCSPAKFRQHERLGRPCLLFHIEKCAGPCVNEVTPSTYARHVDGLQRFLSGDTDDVRSSLVEQMTFASANEQFEDAARLRDRVGAIDRALERQQMVGERGDDFDVVALAESELEAAVHVFYVRKGRVLGNNGYVVDKSEPLTTPQLMQRVLVDLYAEEPALGWPKEVMVSTEPDDVSVCADMLAARRGSKVDVRQPQRGDRRELLQMVMKNATDALVRHRMKRASDHNSRSRAIAELQDQLGLSQAPLRIECYDMAHLQGTDYVGSMVVLEDGLPAKREYRKFAVRDVPGNDDYAAMREVLTRRLSAYVHERDTPAGERGEKPGRFAYPPQLLLVDGGKGQLGVAVEVLHELGLEDEIDVAALAKRFEEVYLPEQTDPVLLPRGSDALFMLQVVRDEAHRFANSFHRERRGRRMKASELDGIAGLGPKRRERLLKEVGGIGALRGVSRERLAALEWLPASVADEVHRRFAGPQ
ncbi:MAG: excinuclease ABC subunit UvrC [Ilumatobacteraceae bacterium]|nr:excinuclease ABC subunit UvrC [Actinomycetota bacterium]NCV47028.1 excinuclease ABC subunit UvrC [Actinomycetota bacterium]NCZ87624.1 excinuclease ABC subunit UvrC [Actinomycetota bacterium]NDA53683.1 excinuclease ABC subunit UvrC [Actinomycetota bacterium]NDD60768.1 excinuclease ABC subunit UvrC [Actinomycetota bacterium]